MIEKITVTKWKCTCERCDNVWESKDENIPVACTNCRNRTWNKKDVRKKKEQKK